MTFTSEHSCEYELRVAGVQCDKKYDHPMIIFMFQLLVRD